MTTTGPGTAGKKALAGVRVLELGPYVALPLTGRILASLGAEVIKVETNKALDEMAFIPAWSRGAGQPDFQRIKKRVSLDVRTPEGLEVFRELVKVSDVFMTNFRRNILDRWGIDFPEVRRLRPDIILMWQTGLGGIGPYYTYKSYGILVQHMAGVSLMTGDEDSPPSAINTSYSDYHTGVFQPSAIIGALMRRRMTGQPATMESSIFKSGAVTAGPAILDFQAERAVAAPDCQPPSGKRPPRRLPLSGRRPLVRHRRAVGRAVGRVPPGPRRPRLVRSPGIRVQHRAPGPPGRVGRSDWPVDRHPDRRGCDGTDAGGKACQPA